MRLNEFDRIYTKPIPWKENPKWFHHPSKKYLLFNKHSNTYIKLGPMGSKEIIVPDPNNEGTKYRQLNGRMFATFRAETFLEKPKVDARVVVNHCDGNKLNDELENLEWVTCSGNLIHAFKSGLRSDNVEMLLTNLMTGKKETFYSLAECARKLKVNPGYLTYYLKKERDYPFLFKWDLKAKDGPVNNLTKYDVGKVAYGSPRPFRVFDTVNKTSKIYGFVTEFAKDMGSTEIFLSRYKSKLYRGRYQIIYINDIDELTEIWLTLPSYVKWREDKKQRTEFSLPKNTKNIVIEENGVKRIFKDSRSFAEVYSKNHRTVPAIVKRGNCDGHKVYYQ